MPSIITKKFRTEITQAFINTITNENNGLFYLTIGKTNEWENIISVYIDLTTEAIPDTFTPNDLPVVGERVMLYGDLTESIDATVISIDIISGVINLYCEEYSEQPFTQLSLQKSTDDVVDNISYDIISILTYIDSETTAFPEIVDCEDTYRSTINNMIAAKRITSDDAQIIIPLIEFETGKIYNQLNNSIDSNTMFNLNKIADNEDYIDTKIITIKGISEHILFLCINNNGYGLTNIQPIAPISENDYFQVMDDGYIWLYLGKVDATSRFVSDNWIELPEPEYTLDGNIVNDNLITILDSGLIINQSEYSYTYSGEKLTDEAVLDLNDTLEETTYPETSGPSPIPGAAIYKVSDIGVDDADTNRILNGIVDVSISESICKPRFKINIAPMSGFGNYDFIYTQYYKGEYDAGTTYNIGDIVISSESYYKSITDANVGNALSVDTEWENITDELSYSIAFDVDAHHAMVAVDFETDTEISTDIIFNELSIIKNPRYYNVTSDTTTYLTTDETVQVVSDDDEFLLGEILYVEQRNTITRNATQTENIKIILEF